MYFSFFGLALAVYYASALGERKRVLPDKLVGIEKLPLDWEQILRVWVVAAGSILAFIWLIKIVSSDAVWRLIHR